MRWSLPCTPPRPAAAPPASSDRPRGAGDQVQQRAVHARTVQLLHPGSLWGSPGSRPPVENSQGHCPLPGPIPLLSRVANAPEATSPCELLCFAFLLSAEKSLMKDTRESCLPQRVSVSSQNRAISLVQPSFPVKKGERGKERPGILLSICIFIDLS